MQLCRRSHINQVYNIRQSKQKLIFQRFYLFICIGRCDHSVCIGLQYTASVHIFLHCFLHLLSVFTNNFGLFKICHTIVTRSVPTCTILALWVRFYDLPPLTLSVNRTTILSFINSVEGQSAVSSEVVRFCQSVISFNKHRRKYGFEFEKTDAKQRPYVLTDIQHRF